MVRIRGLGAALAAALVLIACQGPPPAERAGAGRVGDAQAAGAATLPLIEIMNGLAADMGRLSSAIWAEDYDSVAVYARRVADHPKVGAGQRAAITSGLGEEFARFAATDKQAHDAAVALESAALDRDMEGVLAGLERTQRACVACHATYRDRVRAALTDRR